GARSVFLTRVPRRGMRVPPNSAPGLAMRVLRQGRRPDASKATACRHVAQQRPVDDRRRARAATLDNHGLEVVLIDHAYGKTSLHMRLYRFSFGWFVDVLSAL